jgi:hypothetical protein
MLKIKEFFQNNKGKNYSNALNLTNIQIKMRLSLYKIIWHLINIAFSLFETIFFFSIELREYVDNFINSTMPKHQDDEKLLIEKNVRVLKKVPKHIAVILTIDSEKDVDLMRLTDLVFWALHTKGIDFISFYDCKGNDFFRFCIKKVY